MSKEKKKGINQIFCYFSVDHCEELELKQNRKHDTLCLDCGKEQDWDLHNKTTYQFYLMSHCKGI